MAEWQPIETAPFDTMLLLGWWDKWPTRQWVAETAWAGSTKPYAGWRHGQATRWMPLPEPPAAPAQSKGEKADD